MAEVLGVHQPGLQAEGPTPVPHTCPRLWLASTLGPVNRRHPPFLWSLQHRGAHKAAAPRPGNGWLILSLQQNTNKPAERRLRGQG